MPNPEAVFEKSTVMTFAPSQYVSVLVMIVGSDILNLRVRLHAPNAKTPAIAGERLSISLRVKYWTLRLWSVRLEMLLWPLLVVVPLSVVAIVVVLLVLWPRLNGVIIA
jgi:Na+/glutamate symporter